MERALSLGDLERVRRILSAAAAGGETHPLVADGSALLGSVDDGRADLCRVLLRHGADPNLAHAERGGGTPLHVAAAAGHEAICAVLLEHGASAAKTASDLRTPVHAAAAAATPDALAALLGTPEGRAALMMEDRRGRLPVHYARGAETCEMLLAFGSPPDLVDRYGAAPAEAAAARGDTGSARAAAVIRAWIVGKHPLRAARAVAAASLAGDTDLPSDLVDLCASYVHERDRSCAVAAAWPGRSDEPVYAIDVDTDAV